MDSCSCCGQILSPIASCNGSLLVIAGFLGFFYECVMFRALRVIHQTESFRRHLPAHFCKLLVARKNALKEDLCNW